ncbi:MAG TPA: hypothetical protein VFD83_02630 [Candidatus Polarisedimenticolia bacterium]|nr:hypothetical protein [Candidatus Polarisedimenticolia bacterium]
MGVALLLLLTFVTACGKAPAPGEWRVVPRDASSALGKNSASEAELRTAYGDKNVTRGRVVLGEGFATEGTILFPGDTLRQIEVVWEDSTHQAIPARVFLRGDRSLWKLPRDVTLGMTLAELERRNGRPFTLSGFGWDYEGAVVSWAGGILDTALTSDVKVYLRPARVDWARPEYGALQGDRPFPSSQPEMRALNPRVYQIVVDYEHLPTPGQSARVLKNEIRESDQGMTIPLEMDDRISVILDQGKHPQETLQVLPRGILGQDSSVPDVEPPLYAARFLAVKPGNCVITAKGFWVRVQVREKPKPGA